MTASSPIHQCGWVSPSGNVCIKPAGHTGAHATRKPVDEQQREFEYWDDFGRRPGWRTGEEEAA